MRGVVGASSMTLRRGDDVRMGWFREMGGIGGFERGAGRATLLGVDGVMVTGRAVTEEGTRI